MDPISRFFLWCAGISQRVMDGIDIDYSKYVGLGATIFSTWVLASVSGGYAFYFVFKEQKIAIAFGVMWGLVIFNFDRFIIMTIKKRASFFEELLQMSPRILLAILIGLVISKPLEMKIFESEIKTEITKMSVTRADGGVALLAWPLCRAC